MAPQLGGGVEAAAGMTALRPRWRAPRARNPDGVTSTTPCDLSV